MHKHRLILLLILLVTVWGCREVHQSTAPEVDSANDTIESSPNPEESGDTGSGDILSPREAKLRVIDNCRIFQDALNSFAAQNGGQYPTDISDSNARGITVIDLLPDGLPLENPFTGLRALPVTGIPDDPGEISYLAMWCDYDVAGYLIVGAGQTTEQPFIKIMLDCNGSITETVGRNTPAVADLVLKNCLLVQEAAEAFAAENNGIYPYNLSSTSLAGNTLVDLLPQGTLLVNPVTGQASEPNPAYWGGAGYGTTSFEALRDYDENWNLHTVGYRVTGWFEQTRVVITNSPQIMYKEQRVIKNCLIVSEAADAFAADNGGIYAGDNGYVNLAGKTVQNYLPDGYLLVNPFHKARTEPQWGAVAAGFGETGYIGVDKNGDGRTDGYYIDGMSGGYIVIFEILGGDAQ